MRDWDAARRAAFQRWVARPMRFALAEAVRMLLCASQASDALHARRFWKGWPLTPPRLDSCSSLSSGVELSPPREQGKISG